VTLLAVAPVAHPGPLDTWSPLLIASIGLLLPLLAAVSILVFTVDYRRGSALTSIFLTGCALICALLVLSIEWKHPTLRQSTGPTFINIFTGESGAAGQFQLQWGILTDPLAAVMLVMVTGVSLLVQLYAQESMRREEGYVRFFAGVAFATFAMSGVILSADLFELLAFWLLLGVATYLLLAHRWRTPSAASAARRALLVMVIGDVALLIAVAYALMRFEDFAFPTLHLLTTGHKISANGLLILGLLILCAAAARSAIFPLQAWPDAVSEAPAPAAALIMGATTAASGIYLVARTYPIFAASPRALIALSVAGALTVLVASIAALIEDRITAALAYAGVAVLGLAFLGLGLRAYAGGVLIAVARGFSVALLLLAAGAVAQAMRSELISEMGGVFRRMPGTARLLVLGAAATAGFPLLSGFWGQAAIVAPALKDGPAVAAVAVLCGVLVSAALFRPIFLALRGETARRRRFDPERVRDPTARIRFPKTVLAVPAALIGLLGIPGLSHNIFETVRLPGVPSTEPAVTALVLGAVAALAGVALACPTDISLDITAPVAPAG
jgi:NADH-quinone oxidoreductase subunit L